MVHALVRHPLFTGCVPMTSQLLAFLKELLRLARTESGELLSVHHKIRQLEAGHFVPPTEFAPPAPRVRPQLYLVQPTH